DRFDVTPDLQSEQQGAVAEADPPSSDLTDDAVPPAPPALALRTEVPSKQHAERFEQDKTDIQEPADLPIDAAEQLAPGFAAPERMPPMSDEPPNGGETIASKGQVTGEGKHPMSPAERLKLDDRGRSKAEKCLAEGVYFEARGEPVRGQIAVAQVILNRTFS